MAYIQISMETDWGIFNLHVLPVNREGNSIVCIIIR